MWPPSSNPLTSLHKALFRRDWVTPRRGRHHHGGYTPSTPGRTRDHFHRRSCTSESSAPPHSQPGRRCGRSRIHSLHQRNNRRLGYRNSRSPGCTSC